MFPYGDQALEDLGRRWEGLVFRRASVSTHRDGILVVMEADIWLPAQIVVSSLGWGSVVSSVATFLPMTDGQVACPLWAWKASSGGQCWNFSVDCVREAGAAVTPSAPSSFRIWVQDLTAEPQ